MKVDMSNMTAAQLKKLIADAEKALAKIDKKRKAEAKKAAEKAAKQMGYSLSELVDAAEPAKSKPGRKPRGTAPKKTKGVPKYAHPENPSITWTGQGRKPNWINEGLAAGKTLEDFAIK